MNTRSCAPRQPGPDVPATSGTGGVETGFADEKVWPGSAGDLVVLHTREAPRVRVVLDVGRGSDGSKVVMFDPDAKDGVRAFLASRVATLAWGAAAADACSRAGLKVAPRADPLTRRDGFAEDAGSMVVVEIWAEISDFG